MNIFPYVAVIVLSLIISDKYLNIKSVRTQRVFEIMGFVILIMLIIAFTISLIYFFKLLAQIGPI